MKNGLTIGIPVYNEEGLIERAIRSAAPQCERLIVADNASTDGTAAVCKRLLSEFSNMEYVCHAENIGALNNWSYILNGTHTPYVMFLGSHDHIESGYVDTVLPSMIADDDIECVMGCLVFVRADGSMSPHDAFCDWHGGELSDPRDRIWSFFTQGGSAVWATYGIFRTKIFNALFSADLPRFGPDAIFIANVLLTGKIKISRDTAYLAHQRPKEKSKAAYFERITGVPHSDKDVGALLNEYRVKQYGIIKELYPLDDWFSSLYRRFISMSRFKPFKVKNGDIFYFLFFIPAIIANRLERIINKLK